MKMMKKEEEEEEEEEDFFQMKTLFTVKSSQQHLTK